MKIDSGPLHQPYRILGLDSMRSRRSLADAVDLLRSHAISSNPSRGRFEVAPLFLSSGATVHLVSVHFKNDDDSVDIVPLPSCTHFKAVPVGGSETEKFPVGRLVDAIIEPPMRVRLADGTKLQSFEVIAAPLPLAPTEQQWKIVHGVLAAFGLKQCYRSLREAAQCPDVPDYHFLDIAISVWLLNSPCRQSHRTRLRLEPVSSSVRIWRRETDVCWQRQNSQNRLVITPPERRDRSETLKARGSGSFLRFRGKSLHPRSTWWAREDSNLQPDRYERSALTIELQAPNLF